MVVFLHLLEPCMRNHFSKDLFFIKHKVTCDWKHTSQFTQPQTQVWIHSNQFSLILIYVKYTKSTSLQRRKHSKLFDMPQFKVPTPLSLCILNLRWTVPLHRTDAWTEFFVYQVVVNFFSVCSRLLTSLILMGNQQAGKSKASGHQTSVSGRIQAASTDWLWQSDSRH